MKYSWLGLAILLITPIARANAADKSKHSDHKRSDSEETAINFQIKDVRGTVLLWEPFAREWVRAIPGNSPANESLIQVRPQSSVTFNIGQQNKLEALGSADVAFKINKPTIGRINEQYVRTIKLNRFVIDKFPMAAEEPKEAVTDTAVALLEEAWERFAAVFSGDSIPAGTLEMSSKTRPIDDFEMILKQKKISILAPKHDAVLTSTQFPFYRIVYWRPDTPVPEGTEFDVFFWQKGQTVDKPVGTTKETKYKIPIFPGVYQLQVVSRDKAWSSSIYTFTILEDARVTKGSSTAKSENVSLENAVQLVTPPDDFNLVNNRNRTRVVFHWQSNRGAAPPKTFRLMISDLAETSVIRRVTEKTYFALRLRPGHYRWWVEVDEIANLGEKPFVVRSDSYRLTIDDKKAHWTSRAKTLLENEGGVLYLDLSR